MKTQTGPVIFKGGVSEGDGGESGFIAAAAAAASPAVARRSRIQS